MKIRDNIGLGDPLEPYDDHRIEEAARAGGAFEFVERLPDGFDTYLERPVPDYYSSLPEGTTSLFGRKVDHSRVRRFGGMGSTSSQLSGGQMQRLALCVLNYYSPSSNSKIRSKVEDLYALLTGK